MSLPHTYIYNVPSTSEYWYKYPTEYPTLYIDFTAYDDGGLLVEVYGIGLDPQVPYDLHIPFSVLPDYISRCNYFAIKKGGMYTPFVYGTPTSLIFSFASGISANVNPDNLDRFINHPVDMPWFAPSGKIDVKASAISLAQGDPFIVFDDLLSKYVMYYSTFSGVNVTQSYMTTYTLSGSWSAATDIPSLNGYHKFVFLVDSNGAPVMFNDQYQGYATLLNDSITGNGITRFTSPTLYGPWTNQGVVIPRGEPDKYDSFNANTPFALYDKENARIIVFYTGTPTSSMPDTGLELVQLRAIASDPSGLYTKDPSPVLKPSIVAPVSPSLYNWDYGWIGGVQVLKIPESEYYVMIYNAGSARPDSHGDVSDTSRIGYAYCSSLDGPWIKYPYPILQPINWPPSVPDSNNTWRGHMIWDLNAERWTMFYKTGTIGIDTGELITHAISKTFTTTYPELVSRSTNKVSKMSINDQLNAPKVNNKIIQTITNTKTQIADSRIDLLTPGVYNITYEYSIGTIATFPPSSLNITTTLKISNDNGTSWIDVVSKCTYVDGNCNTNLNDIITYQFLSESYTNCIALDIQVTDGIPTTNTCIRSLKYNIFNP